MYRFASRISVLLQLECPGMVYSPRQTDSIPVEKLVEMVLSLVYIYPYMEGKIVWSTANLELRPPSLRIVNSVFLFRFLQFKNW